jgi:hypothetical protein
MQVVCGVLFCLRWTAKSTKVSASSFASTTTTKTPEMLHDSSGEHSFNWAVVSEWRSGFKAS